MRKAYQFWGIPFNMKKAVEDVESSERLGAFLDGKAGRIGVTVKRALETMSLGLWILSQGQTTRKSLQVFAGKEVHSLQFRRPLFSNYDELWRIIAGQSDEPYLTVRLCVEILVSLCLVPLRFTDWRSEVDPFVMASDASEKGGGFCMARRLTPLGKELALRPQCREEGERSGVLVFDFFSGIGGLLRALERCKLRWEHHVVIESDKNCRRLLRRVWPGGSEYTDVNQLTKEILALEMGRVDNLKLVIAGGGSPCQGLTKLSSKRKHFNDERSGLFFSMADAMDALLELCDEKGIQFLGLVENVVMDEQDRDDISLRLGWMPHLAQWGCELGPQTSLLLAFHRPPRPAFLRDREA